MKVNMGYDGIWCASFKKDGRIMVAEGDTLGAAIGSLMKLIKENHNENI